MYKLKKRQNKKSLRIQKLPQLSLRRCITQPKWAVGLQVNTSHQNKEQKMSKRYSMKKASRKYKDQTKRSDNIRLDKR